MTTPPAPRISAQISTHAGMARPRNFQLTWLHSPLPVNTWQIAAPNEYGFWANVNPTVDHPRWSQAKERPLGQLFKKPTLMFNGYADQVASMYSGMDLRANF